MNNKNVRANSLARNPHDSALLCGGDQKHIKLHKKPVKPFLKWAGGKRSLLPEILARMPDEHFDLYLEPFLGGGALFLELYRQGRIKKAVLNDRNPELINTWKMVRDEPDRVIEVFGQWSPTESCYYEVRAIDESGLSAIERAARVIWLNRHCFNGLYRLNRSGRFNVPFGKYKRVPTIDHENLFAVSEALQCATLYQLDFSGVLAMAGEGSFVYCDPPYWPVSTTASFTAYDGQTFTAMDQHRLATAFGELGRRGAIGLLSNSWTEETVELYQSHGLVVDQVFCRRSINRDASKRGPVPEVMVTNYDWAAQQIVAQA